MVLGIVAYRSSKTVRQTNELIEHTKDVLAESELVLSLTKDIVMGSQRYVITGDSAFLGRYPSSSELVYVHLDKLQRLATENPVQQARIDSLHILIRKRIEFSDKYIRIRNQSGYEAAASLIATGEGQAYMNNIRDLIGAIEGQENFLLILRQQENDNSISAFNRAFYALLGSVAIFLFVILIYIRYNLRKRERAEERLRQSEAQIRTIFRGAPDAVIVINEKGRIINWNPRSEILFGWTEKEVTGMLLSETIIPHRHREAHKKGMQHFLKTGHGPMLEKPIEMQALNKEGREFDVALSISPASTGDGHLFIGFIRDITEKKKAEKELVSSRENFKRLFEYAPYPMWVYDLETLKFLEVNEAAINQYGYSRDEFLQMSVTEIRPKEEIPRLMESIKVRRSTDFHISAGWKHVLRSGKLIDVEITSQRIDFTGHEATLVIANNITDRKRSEEEIKRTNHFLDTILENIPNMIFVKDAEELRFVRFNKAGEDLLGYSRNDLIGKNDYDFFPKEQADFFTQKDKDVLAKGTLLDITEEPINTLGGERILHTKKIPIMDKDGKPIYLLGISEDITARKIAEQRMQELNEQFIRIFNLSPVAMAISNIEDGQITQVNESFERLFMLGKEDAIGRSFAELRIREDDRNQLLAYIESKQGHVSEMEMKLRKTNGEIIDALVSIEKIVIDKRPSLISAAMDITRRKKDEDQIMHLNSELEKSVEQLQVVNKELEAFTYSVSHDLRAPLRIINGYAEIIIEDCKEKMDAEALNNLEVIKFNAGKMGQLIDDLLNLSRLGRQELALHNVNMDELVDRVIAEQVGLSKKHHAKVKKLPLLPAHCDSGLIQQVWTNLISNALKYSGTKEYPEVEIGSNRKEHEIVYYVKDNGVGFDMQYAGKLFGVFQRLHKMTEFEGTGVGLAIVQRIVIKHGGRVWAEAEVEKGATFFFSLPG